MIKNIHAWLIHQQPWREDTASLTLLSKEKGKLFCFYQAAPAFAGRKLPLFTPLSLVVSFRKEPFRIQELSPLKCSPVLSEKALFTGFYANELIYRCLVSSEPHALLFEAYSLLCQSLSQIKEGQSDGEKYLRVFELLLLEASGYAPSFTLETTVGSFPLNPEQYYQFLPQEGFVLAKQGFSGKALLALSQKKLETEEVCQTAKLLFKQVIDYYLGGKKLLSRKLYEHHCA